MGTHMKTTIEISDELLARSKRLAESRGLTLRALVEEGLQRSLDAHAISDRPPFVLHTFGQGGLTPEAEARGAHSVILETYEEESRWPATRPASIQGVHDRDRG